MKTRIIVPLFALLVSCAAGAADQAPIKLDIANPMTVTIQHSMQQRVSRLVKFYEPGVIGLLKNGNLGVRDPSRLNKIATRQIVEKLIDAENNDRQALIAAVAVANERRSEVDAFRLMMARKWANELHSGWWYQDEQDNWIQKP